MTKILLGLYRLSGTELWCWKKTYRLSINDLYDFNLVLFTAI